MKSPDKANGLHTQTKQQSTSSYTTNKNLTDTFFFARTETQDKI